MEGPKDGSTCTWMAKMASRSFPTYFGIMVLVNGLVRRESGALDHREQLPEAYAVILWQSR